jgi:hypothetical protein
MMQSLKGRQIAVFAPDSPLSDSLASAISTAGAQVYSARLELAEDETAVRRFFEEMPRVSGIVYYEETPALVPVSPAQWESFIATMQEMAKRRAVRNDRILTYGGARLNAAGGGPIVMVACMPWFVGSTERPKWWFVDVGIESKSQTKIAWAVVRGLASGSPFWFRHPSLARAVMRPVRWWRGRFDYQYR